MIIGSHGTSKRGGNLSIQDWSYKIVVYKSHDYRFKMVCVTLTVSKLFPIPNPSKDA